MLAHLKTRKVKKLIMQDPNAPKRPMSAYFLFMNENRPTVIILSFLLLLYIVNDDDGDAVGDHLLLPPPPL